MSRTTERRFYTSSQVQQDDVIGTVGDVPPSILCETVEAVCVRIEDTFYRPWCRRKLVLSFQVYAPEEHAGQIVQMFLRIKRDWPYIPASANVFKAASVSLGRKLRRGEKITKSMFLRKAFRCRLRQSGTAPASYSVVAVLLEKLTG